MRFRSSRTIIPFAVFNLHGGRLNGYGSWYDNPFLHQAVVVPKVVHSAICASFYPAHPDTKPFISPVKSSYFVISLSSLLPFILIDC